MATWQKTIRLRSFRRGFHLITDLIEQAFPEIGNY